MQKFWPSTWIVVGLLPLIALAGCTHPGLKPLPPAPIVVTIHDTPPSDLTACPVAPAGFPATASADMPAPVRAAAIRLALAYRALSDQLARLIDWSDPSANCATPGQPVNLLPPAMRAPPNMLPSPAK